MNIAARSKQEAGNFPVSISTPGDPPGTLCPPRVQTKGAEGTEPFLHLHHGVWDAPAGCHGVANAALLVAQRAQ